MHPIFADFIVWVPIGIPFRPEFKPKIRHHFMVVRSRQPPMQITVFLDRIDDPIGVPALPREMPKQQSGHNDQYRG